MSGRCIAVVGACGGAGSSLVAGALALVGVRRGPGVHLIDLDLERGDLAGDWDAPDERSVADLLPVTAELRPAHVRHVRHGHASGVELVASPCEPGAADGWSAECVARLVAAVRAEGDCVVDLGSGLSVVAGALAEVADVVLVVAPASLRGARRVLRIRAALEDRHVVPRLIVNAGAGMSEMGPAALGTAVGLPVAATLPASAREAAELGAGRWPRARRGGLARAVCDLAAAL